MRTWRWYSKLLFALLVAAFAYYVWPTPWTCYQIDPGSSRSSWLRVNRFTGRTELLWDLKGWQRDLKWQRDPKR